MRKKAVLLWGVLSAMAAAAQEPPATLRLDLGGGVSLELMRVKAGSFEQGSPEGERGRAPDEAPRRVTLTRDFYVGKHEVTLRQFARFVQETGYKTEAEKGTSGGFGWDGKALVQGPRYNWRDPGYPVSDEHPVTIVTYGDALAFAAWLTRRAGREVTLPTEAEWEYAARGGSASRFFAGDSDDVSRQIGWYKANASTGPQAVGQKKPNGFGLYDTAGNVSEWCRDWYGPYRPGPVSDPLETRETLSDRPRRVLRGGSWLKQPGDLRSAARYRNAPGSRNADNGFRVVAAVTAASAAAPVVQTQPAVQAAQTTRTTAQPASFGAPMSYLLLPCAFGLVILAGIVFVILKGVRGIFGDKSSPRIKQGRDGFTIYAPRARPGETIRYRYAVQGRPETGEMTVPSDPSQGMFVFTGTTPSNVEILSVLAASAAAAPGRPRGAAPPPPPPQQRGTPRRDDDDYDDSQDRFRGYPSAY